MPFSAYIILILSLGLSPAKQDNSLLDWNADRKLTWNDFESEPDKNAPIAALTSTTIKIDFGYNNDAFQYHIHCRFNKRKSWGRVKNEYILSHEQAHFDIAEIYARKLNKALQAYKPSETDMSKEVNKIYDETMQEYYEMQDQYDNETDFSINRRKQAEWLRKISRWLVGLKDYAHYD